MTARKLSWMSHSRSDEMLGRLGTSTAMHAPSPPPPTPPLLSPVTDQVLTEVIRRPTALLAAPCVALQQLANLRHDPRALIEKRYLSVAPAMDRNPVNSGSDSGSSAVAPTERRQEELYFEVVGLVST